MIKNTLLNRVLLLIYMLTVVYAVMVAVALYRDDLLWVGILIFIAFVGGFGWFVKKVVTS